MVRARRPDWVPLNLTLVEWGDRVDGSPTHEGTLLLTARGVFEAGMEGSSYLGEKREDGSVKRYRGRGWPEHIEPPWLEEGEVILEYADPPAGYSRGCWRTSSGAIQCACTDGDWWWTDLISKVPEENREWVASSLLLENALAWCPKCRRVGPADLACLRCGALTEPVRLVADGKRRPS